MATAAEQTFFAAVVKAEGVRQVAKAAAFTANAVNGAIPAANLATYIAALATADDAFFTTVNGANSGPFGYTIPNSGGTNPGNIEPGLIGFSGISPLQALGGGLGTLGAIG